MVFTGILKKGSKRKIEKELGISDPGSDDSWAALYNSNENGTKQVAAKNQSAKSPCTSNIAHTFINVGGNVSNGAVIGRTQHSGIVSPTMICNAVTVKESAADSEEKITGDHDATVHGNKRTQAFTSTPFVKHKKAPTFEVSSIISPIDEPSDVNQREGSPILADSLSTLVVNRKNPRKHAGETFNQLLDPQKKSHNHMANEVPGIQPLKTVMNQGDTTRQYAGGAVRGKSAYFTNLPKNSDGSSWETDEQMTCRSVLETSTTCTAPSTATKSLNRANEGVKKDSTNNDQRLVNGNMVPNDEMRMQQVSEKVISQQQTFRKGGDMQNDIVHNQPSKSQKLESPIQHPEVNNTEKVGRSDFSGQNMIIESAMNETHSIEKVSSQNLVSKEKSPKQNQASQNVPKTNFNGVECGLRQYRKEKSARATSVGPKSKIPRKQDCSVESNEIHRNQREELKETRNSVVKQNIPSVSVENKTPERSEKGACELRSIDRVESISNAVQETTDKTKQFQKPSDNVGHCRTDVSDCTKPKKTVETDSNLPNLVCRNQSSKDERHITKTTSEQQPDVQNLYSRQANVKAVYLSKSEFAVNIGNVCLKQSSCFGFSLSQKKSKSNCVQDKPKLSVISNHSCQTVNTCLPRLSNGLEGKLVALSQEKEVETVCISPPMDLNPQSASSKSKDQEESVSNTLPQELEKDINSPEDVSTNDVTGPGDESKQTAKANETESSSEEERILLRSQSQKLRENQGHSSRITRSPKMMVKLLGVSAQSCTKGLKHPEIISPTKSSSSVQNEEEILTPQKEKNCEVNNYRVKEDQMSPEQNCAVANKALLPNTLNHSMNHEEIESDEFVYLSRNPKDTTPSGFQETSDDGLQLEIMSSSDEDIPHKHQKANPRKNILERSDKQRQNVGGKSSHSMKGRNVSLKVKEIRRRREEKIGELLKSSDNESEPNQSSAEIQQDVIQDHSSLETYGRKHIRRRKDKSRNCIEALNTHNCAGSQPNHETHHEKCGMITRFQHEARELETSHRTGKKTPNKNQSPSLLLNTENINASCGDVPEVNHGSPSKKHVMINELQQGPGELRGFLDKNIVEPDAKEAKRPRGRPRSRKDRRKEVHDDPVLSNKHHLLQRNLSKGHQVAAVSQEQGGSQHNERGDNGPSKINLSVRIRRCTDDVDAPGVADGCHEQIPVDHDQEDELGFRHSRRKRRPPTQYWLGQRRHYKVLENGCLETIDESLISSHQQPTCNNVQRPLVKSKKRRIEKEEKTRNSKVQKTVKESKSTSDAYQSTGEDRVLVCDTKSVFVESGIDQFSFQEKELHRAECVWGCGMRGDLLILGIGAKFDAKKLSKYNQVYYVVEGDISYNAGQEEINLPAGSFFLVPKGEVCRIANTGSSPVKLVLVSCKA